MTLDDQLAALDLPGPVVARLAGLAAQTLREKRMRGAALSNDQLLVLEQRLRETADVARGMVKAPSHLGIRSRL